MARIEAQPLRRCIGPTERFLSDANGRVRFADLIGGTTLGGRLDKLAGRSVLVACGDQRNAALALIELDGVARRIAILPADADPVHLPAIFAGAEIDAIVVDANSPASAALDLSLRVVANGEVMPDAGLPAPDRETEWVMLTSGTTGVPKMVVHTRAGLTASFAGRPPGDDAVWSTFYDVRRYGGLQILLRAVLGGTSLVLSDARAPVEDFLLRVAAHGATHLLGTPTHWRRALMSPALRDLSLRYVRLSGEIADQAVLDALRQAFPRAIVSHAYASTEAGVAFEVRDGLAGFPATFVETSRDGVEMRVVEGSLRIRSPRTAIRYIGSEATLTDADGFVDSGDMVERRAARYLFAGRRGGIINIGGLKVHPEEVEAVINRHPRVRMSLVRGRPSPITGAVVVADVVLESTAAEPADAAGRITSEILQSCRDALPRHKVPAAVSIVPDVEVAATGKLARRHG